MNQAVREAATMLVGPEPSYRAGQLPGFDEPRLVEALMFIAVEHAPLAARFVNGDWSEIDLIIPIADRFVRQAGRQIRVRDGLIS
jgi:hypothetical protein